jgi:hypothetical protein
LYEQFLSQQFRKRPSNRSVKHLESFLDSAEEDLTTERLSFEFHTAERIPFAETPVEQTPHWYFLPYNSDRDVARLTLLLSNINLIRLSEGESKLDNFVEYYWNLNHRGHIIFLEEFRNKEVPAYNPALYRQRIIAEDIARVKGLFNFPSPASSSNSSPYHTAQQ